MIHIQSLWKHEYIKITGRCLSVCFATEVTRLPLPLPTWVGASTLSGRAGSRFFVKVGSRLRNCRNKAPCFEKSIILGKSRHFWAFVFGLCESISQPAEAPGHLVFDTNWWTNLPMLGRPKKETLCEKGIRPKSFTESVHVVLGKKSILWERRTEIDYEMIISFNEFLNHQCTIIYWIPTSRPKSFTARFRLEPAKFLTSRLEPGLISCTSCDTEHYLLQQA